jgi:hypothetical protein
MLVVHLTAAVSLVLMAGLVVAAAAALLRRWPLAARVSRGGALGAAATLGALLVFMAILMVEPKFARGLLPDSSDPSQLARVLAELIARLMNCGALSVLVGLLAAPVWFLARRRSQPAKA